MPPILFIVDRKEAGQTLAAVLKKRFGLSWSHAKRLVENRHVKIGQQVETDVTRRVKAGKRVQLESGTVHGPEAARGAALYPKPGSRAALKPQATKATPPPPTRSPRPTPARVKQPPAAIPGLEIVYADDSVVVVNKPAGLTTMRHKDEADEFGPGKRFLPRTLADILPGLLGTPDRRLTAVHRIDRDTSGLVVFALTRAAAEHLTRQFREHTTDRRYLALVRGLPTPGRIESLMVRDRGDGRRGSAGAKNTAETRRAVTHVRVVEAMGKYSAVECRLETGRTHQVRIHLGEAGTPLCGERVYDRPPGGKPLPDGSGADHPMLHAARLGFNHPDTNEMTTWEVKPPDEFSQLWAKLRNSTS